MTWTPTPTTLAELEGSLEEGELSICIHRGAGPERYVVHLYAPDDPACLVTGDGMDLAAAVADALGSWAKGGSSPPIDHVVLVPALAGAEVRGHCMTAPACGLDGRCVCSCTVCQKGTN